LVTEMISFNLGWAMRLSVSNVSFEEIKLFHCYSG
jgi:hypothetical protein